MRWMTTESEEFWKRGALDANKRSTKFEKSVAILKNCVMIIMCALTRVFAHINLASGVGFPTPTNKFFLGGIVKWQRNGFIPSKKVT